jgi:hypothetical protein
MKNQIISIAIVSAIAIMLIGSTIIMPTNNAEAKKKKKEYAVEVRFVNACTCSYPVTVKVYNDDGHVIAKRSVDISHLADVQDDSEIRGPTIKVIDKADQHPNELSACAINSHGRDCSGLDGSGKKFIVTFDADRTGDNL